MRLNQFRVGDKVHVPFGTPCKSRYSTVEYIGEYVTVLRTEDNQEFTTNSNEEGFEHFKTEANRLEDVRKLTVLGRDLIAAIELAIPHYLPGLTLHMRSAIDNFREELRRV